VKLYKIFQFDFKKNIKKLGSGCIGFIGVGWPSPVSTHQQQYTRVDAGAYLERRQ
jgi:hypothetical protein